MDFLSARSWPEALLLKAERPDSVAINGGTDLMVELNFDRRRPPALLDLNGVAELGEWQRLETSTGDQLRIGAGMCFTRIIEELASLAPGLAIAARTVGSPQIRNRGTLGGQLGTASPAGDATPPLVAMDGTVEIGSVRGDRMVAIRDFFTGPKRNVLAADELVRAVRVPVFDGPQQFAKVGTRNAMVIAVCSFAFVLRPEIGVVGSCIGSAGPTPLRALEADKFLMDVLTDGDLWHSPDPLDAAVIEHFGELAGAAARPIDDVRGTAAYRRHAVSVLARRTLSWTWTEHREAQHRGAVA